jgi:uncharacterized membrane protein
MKNRDTVLAGAVGLGIVAAVVMLESFGEFLWRYIWGPVVADATGGTASYHGIVAQQGYNIYNTALYALIAAGSLYLLVKLLERWDIGTDQRFVLSLFPMLVFGGLLRVVEDAGLLAYPFNTFLITPVIYFTVFFITLGLIRLSMVIAERNMFGTNTYYLPLSGLGSFAALVPLAALTRYGYQQTIAGTLPSSIRTVVLIGLGGILVGIGLQKLLAPYKPNSFLNTNVGYVATIGQALDGSMTAANISILGYQEKHVLSDAIISAAGTPYAFAVLKIVLILGILAAIEKEELDDRFTLLVVLGIAAVGLGPAIRNLGRALLGV